MFSLFFANANSFYNSLLSAQKIQENHLSMIVFFLHSYIFNVFVFNVLLETILESFIIMIK